MRLKRIPGQQSLTAPNPVKFDEPGITALCCFGERRIKICITNVGSIRRPPSIRAATTGESSALNYLASIMTLSPQWDIIKDKRQRYLTGGLKTAIFLSAGGMSKGRWASTLIAGICQFSEPITRALRTQPDLRWPASTTCAPMWSARIFRTIGLPSQPT